MTSHEMKAAVSKEKRVIKSGIREIGKLCAQVLGENRVYDSPIIRIRRPKIMKTAASKGVGPMIVATILQVGSV
jgi:hypothetical protein